MNIETAKFQISTQNIMKTSTSHEITKSFQLLQQVREQMQFDPAYQPTLQEKTLLNAVQEINTKLSGENIEVEVSFHEKTKEPIIKLVNTVSKQIIREIPSEKIVDMIANMCEMAGLYVDEKK